MPRRRWRYELDQGTGDGDIPMLVQKDEIGGDGGSSSSSSSSSNNKLGASGSLFGGTSAPDTRGSHHRHHKSSAPSTHSNPSFFRSVANLSLSHLQTRGATFPAFGVNIIRKRMS